MNWVILIIAGLFEVAFALCLGKANETNGNETYYWYTGFLFAQPKYIVAYKSHGNFTMGTAYAVWTVIGAVGTIIMGIIFFKEPASFLRLFFISTLIASMVGIKAVSQ